MINHSLTLLKTIKNGEKRCAVRLSEYECINTVLSLKDKLTWVWIDFFTKFPIDFKTYKILKKIILNYVLFLQNYRDIQIQNV